MKKYLLLLVTFGLFLFASCSDDDDNGVETSIVGTWEVTDIETIAPVDPNACGSNVSTITFNEDNSLSSTFYFEQSNCQEDSTTGTWENLGGGNYVMELGTLGELDGTVRFANADRFTFSTVIEIEEIDVPAVFTLERQ